jgi:hypothetical protein
MRLQQKIFVINKSKDSHWTNVKKSFQNKSKKMLKKVKKVKKNVFLKKFSEQKSLKAFKKHGTVSRKHTQLFSFLR